ncbi:coiled coil [Cryptosporidium bovis]|uniref:coiled coil n=1 Tax=Cryptosporidium bovis TaxID=310047 RepID=UPI00351A1312|nr:coiled coil [Cryptosporidium bovis]
MSLQDTTSTAGILAELNNRLTSYESTIRELRSKNRDFVNRLRDSQQIRKDLCIKVNGLQNDLEKKEKELKHQKDQNKQLKKRVTNLNELNSNYQTKIEELKSLCEKLQNSNKNFERINGVEIENDKEINYENKNSPTNRNLKNLINFQNQNKSVTGFSDLDDKLVTESNSNKSLLVKEGDLEFSVEEINDENMKYTPVPDDPIDRAIATFTNSRENKILFTRVKQGTYVYGRLMVEAKLVTKPGVDKNKPLLRIVSRGKLYTLADFVNTHEDEELKNIENSIKNQKNVNLLSSEGQTLVVTSPLNNFRATPIPTPSSPIALATSSIPNQNKIQSTPTSTGFHQYLQSPLSLSSNRLQMIDANQSQNVNFKNYLVNYQNNIYDFVSKQSASSPITATLHSDICGIQHYYVNNNNNNNNSHHHHNNHNHNHSNFNLKQTTALTSQQYPCFQLNEGFNNLNQCNRNINYQLQAGNGPTLTAPPPMAEYMPVTTPIMMTRQPINSLCNTKNNNIISLSSTKKNTQNLVSETVDLKSQNDKKFGKEPPESIQLKETIDKISSPSLFSRTNIQNFPVVENDQTSKDLNNTSNFNPKPSQSKQNIQYNIDNNPVNEELKQIHKAVPQQLHSPVKSVSSSTINEWYRQANILKRFNTFENLPISYAKI